MIQSIPENIHSNGDYSFVLDTFYVYTGDASDQFVQNYCRKYGVWDSDLTHWMINNIQKGWVCLDIGSNVGYFTELLAHLTGKEGAVFSFEPNPILVNKYLESMSINNHEDCAEITVLQRGLSNKKETLELIVPSKNVGAANFTDKDYQGNCHRFLVEVNRLDTLFFERIDFIKMDIEGYEEIAWEGFPESALQCPLMVVELGSYHSESFLRMLEKNYHMTDLSGNPISARKIKTDKTVEFTNTVLKRKA